MTQRVDGARALGAVAYLGLGGNIGDVRSAIRRALAALEDDKLRVSDRSSDYRTPAWGNVDQPDFINACARVRTSYSPHELLARCLAVERENGRVRGERWGPRTIEIDVLLFDDVSFSDAQLTLPHPALLERGFVLVPLAELAPDLMVAGLPIAEAVRRVDRQGIQRLAPDTTLP